MSGGSTRAASALVRVPGCRRADATRTLVGASGQVWLRHAIPDVLSGLVFDVGEPWPIEAGRVCDLASVSVALGQEMVSLAEHIPGLCLGPVFAGAEQVTFCLELGASTRLLDQRRTGWQSAQPGLVRPLRTGEIALAPPPVDWRGRHARAGGAVWLIAPTGSRALPRAGRFCHLASAAASTLELTRAAWRDPLAPRQPPPEPPSRAV